MSAPACNKSSLTAERLREVLSYDAGTGEFTWRKQLSGRRLAGAPAGFVKHDGYRRISIDNANYPAHWLAWFYAYAQWPESPLDHINGDRADNKIANLRQASVSENAQNQALRPNKHAPGVARTTGGYVAKIRVRGDRRYLGCFRSAEEASAAYLEAKSQLHPRWRAKS